VAAGPPEIVLPALVNLEKNLMEQCGIELQRTKTELLKGRSCRVVEEEIPEGMVRAGVQVEDKFCKGFLLYGAPIGEPRYVGHMLQEQAKEIVV
jgi:hypothetical protein